jgi:hypothetical protein
MKRSPRPFIVLRAHIVPRGAKKNASDQGCSAIWRDKGKAERARDSWAKAITADAFRRR